MQRAKGSASFGASYEEKDNCMLSGHPFNVSLCNRKLQNMNK